MTALDTFLTGQWAGKIPGGKNVTTEVDATTRLYAWGSEDPEADLTPDQQIRMKALECAVTAATSDKLVFPKDAPVVGIAKEYEDYIRNGR